MRAAVLSDVHGNRPALESVLEAVGDAGAQEIWCLGDTVGYGAEPAACVALIQEHAALCLAGNHDLVVSGVLPLEEFSQAAAVAADWTNGVLTDAELSWLAALQPFNTDGPVGLFHASPRDPVWEYVLSPLQAELCLDAQSHRVCLVGHSHVALSFSRSEGEPASGETRVEGDRLELHAGEWIINPGSVGQPRDGDPRAAWLELDTDRWTARYHRVRYDVHAAAMAIRAARLPESLAERLALGR